MIGGSADNKKEVRASEALCRSRRRRRRIGQLHEVALAIHRHHSHATTCCDKRPVGYRLNMLAPNLHDTVRPERCNGCPFPTEIASAALGFARSFLRRQAGAPPETPSQLIPPGQVQKDAPDHSDGQHRVCKKIQCSCPANQKLEEIARKQLLCRRFHLRTQQAGGFSDRAQTSAAASWKMCFQSNSASS